MTKTDLQLRLERVQTWPDEAQDEFVAMANQIESELHGGTYVATQDELRMIDAALIDIESGNTATNAEIEAVFAKFRR